MGIRIHKMMGYGLVDLVPETDSRINWDSPLFQYEMSRKATLEYYEWRCSVGDGSRDLGETWDRMDAYKNASKIQSCVEWGTEDGGLENVLCVRPLSCPDWYRYDDAIDYAEQTFFSADNEQRDQAQTSDHALYPYDSYMDARTGERVRDAHALVRLRNRHRRTGTLDDLDIEDALPSSPYKTIAELNEFLVPFVPDDVRRMCEFSKLFVDPKTALDLRPMVYTWWA